MRDEAKNIIPDTLRLRLHTDPQNVSASADFDIPLYDGVHRLWKIHTAAPEADIALLQPDKTEIEKGFCKGVVKR